MVDPVRLLEDRVARAIDRLGSLSRERDELRREVEELRDRVATLEKETRGAGTLGRDGWQRERQRVATTLRETLGELRVE